MEEVRSAVCEVSAENQDTSRRVLIENAETVHCVWTNRRAGVGARHSVEGRGEPPRWGGNAKLRGTSLGTTVQRHERDTPWKVAVNHRAIKEEKEILGGLIGWLAARWAQGGRRVGD